MTSQILLLISLDSLSPQTSVHAEQYPSHENVALGLKESLHCTMQK